MAEGETWPVGPVVDPLPAGMRPDRRTLFGRSVNVEPIEVARHAFDLYHSFQDDSEGRIWTYLGYGPFKDYDSFRAWLVEREASADPFFYAIVPKRTGKAAGMASLMRMAPEHGTIEVGHIWMSNALKQTREATEAIYLLMRHGLTGLGNRRLEWKCDALNAPSRKAAERFGFTFEGIFRKHYIVKGRNRDTAWFSIVDSEWPAIDAAFQAWLADANFDAEGRQRQRLRAREARGIDRA